MENTELDDLHKVDFETLKAVVGVFEKHDLSYFLIAGTLLGAVRHQGFIPWDDDMDIGVPRKSYDLFLDKYKNELPERYKVENFRSNSEAKYYITRILDTHVMVEEIRDHSKTYAAIDLFPIDGTPNNNFFRRIFILHVMVLRMLVSFSQSDNIDMNRKRKLWEKVLIKVAKVLPLNKVINRQRLFKRLDKILSKYSLEHSKYIGSLMGAYRSKELFKSDFTKELIKIKFETDYFLAPKNWDGYLRGMYGDYMKVPPLDSRKAKRHFRIIKGANHV